VFNILVLNNDDHPRNFGFLSAGGGRWRLSPLYDVVPGAVTGESYYLAMEAGAEGKAATLRNALSACERFRLDPADARALAEELRDAVATDWEAHFRACGVRDDAIAALRRNFERDVAAG
jgi:serine/threonine-protein kinase HipA